MKCCTIWAHGSTAAAPYPGGARPERHGLHALLSGTYAGGSMDEVMARDYLAGRYWGAMDSNEEGFWNFETMNLKGEQKDCAVYLSFWLFSPGRWSTCCWNPTCPVSIWNSRRTTNWPYTSTATFSTTRSNGRTTPPCRSASRHSARKGLEPCSAQGRPVMGGWNGRFRFTATDPAYMRQLESVIMQ
ncbi:MAG: hypothetical protein ACLRMJ_09155 [Alistipes finegoldii]